MILGDQVSAYFLFFASLSPIMSDSLSFTDADVSAILQNAPSLQELDIAQGISHCNDWDKLNELKKTQIKTLLHSIIMTEYLRASISPRGLLINIEPHIFLEDLAFRLDWSKISWHCTRDWIILIIQTAQRISDDLLNQIKTLEGQIKSLTVPSQYKTQLDNLNREISDFKDYLLQQKVTKLKKDVKKFSLEKVYPYTKTDYAPSNVSSVDSFSSIDSSDSGSGSESNNTYRGRRQGRGRNRGKGNNRGFPYLHNFPPQPMTNYHMMPPGFIPPFYAPPPVNPQPFWGIPPNFQQPSQQYMQRPPFLGRGRGPFRPRWKGPQHVSWVDEESPLGPVTRSKTAQATPGPSSSS